MSNFLIILFCLFAGYSLKKAKIVKEDGFKAINTWVIYVGLPATSFLYLPELYWDKDILIALLAPWFIFLGSVIFIKILEKKLHLSKRTSHTLILISGLSNTSFVGFPLVASYFGGEMIKWAIICDQMTFFILSTLGVVLALQGQGGKNTKIPVSYMLKRVLTFPPLIGCILALLLPKFIDMDGLKPFFGQLSSTVSPLALFSIGMQLSLTFSKSEAFTMGISLLYKLILAPLLLIGALYFLRFQGEIVRIAAFEMAMPSLVATSMILQEFKLNTKLGNSIIGFSIVIGLVTTWLAYQCIHFLL